MAWHLYIRQGSYYKHQSTSKLTSLPLPIILSLHFSFLTSSLSSPFLFCLFSCSEYGTGHDRLVKVMDEPRLLHITTILGTILTGYVYFDYVIIIIVINFFTFPSVYAD